MEGIQNNIGEDCIIYDEVDSAKAYLDNFTFKSKVEEALSATEIIGAVGDIILPKEYQDLAQTLSFGKNIFDKLTNSNKSLLEISTIIYDIRFAAISNQWEDVEVLVKQQIMNNSLQKYKQELELLAGESKNRKVVIRLSDALTQDMPTGTLEQADLSSTTTRYLKEAIDFARSHDSLTSAAKLLLSSAQYIMDLRALLLKPEISWKDIREMLAKIKTGSIANIVDDEIDFISKLAEDGYVIDILNEAYEVGKVSGNVTDESFEGVTYVSIDNVLKKVNKLVCHTKRAKQNVVIASLIKRLRISVIENHLEAMDALVKEAFTLKDHFSISAFQEINFVSDVVRHRKIIKILSEGVKHGGVVGEVGKVNYHDIQVLSIDNCIYQAQEIGYVTEEAQQLLIATEALRRLRLELKGKQWLILQETLDAVYNAGVPVLLQQEIRLIKDECDDALMKAELIECMTEGERYGNVGSFDVNDVDPSPIETAIVNAKKIKPKTLETQTLLKTALLLFAVRTQMLSQDYAKVDEILALSDMDELSPIINDEISFYEKVIRNFIVIRDLIDAFSSGTPTRTDTRLDITTIRTKRLEAAVKQAEESELHTAEAENYLSTGKVLLNLRVAVVNDDWKLVDQVLKDSRTTDLAEQVAEELKCIQDLADDKNLVFELREVLQGKSDRRRWKCQCRHHRYS